MIHQLIFTKLLGELDYGAGTGMGDFNAAGYNTAGVWTWNTHDADWIYQGGADPSTKHQVYWNEYSDLDDSPVSWHITEPVDPCTADPWLSAIGKGIY